MRIQDNAKVFEIDSKFIFTEEVKHIFDVFLGKKDKIRLVGGCIRNFLLGLEINDYDFATKYKPEETISILKKNKIKYFTVGKEFGTIKAIINNKKFEITTLRKDFNQDGRHTNIAFTDEYFEDAKRRDFTFNALYLDCEGLIYDYFSGYADLKKGLVRFIGNPAERIQEDYLRILRFFRFFACYGSVFEYESLEYCKKYSNCIEKLSVERIRDEFSKILISNYPIKTLSIMQNSGVLKHILFCDSKIDFGSLSIFCSIRKFINFEYDFIFILAVLFLDNDISDINLSLSNRERKDLQSLLENKFVSLDEFEIKKKIFLLKDKNFIKKLLVLYFCKNLSDFSTLKESFNLIDNWEIPTFSIKGHDLINQGFNERKKYSLLLNKAKEIFINSNFKISREEIIEELKKDIF